MNKWTNIAFLFFLNPTLGDDNNIGARNVVLENENVLVVRLTYPPGSQSGMHTHVYHHRVVYFVKGGTLQLIPEDAKSAVRTLEVIDGQTLYLPATTHNVVNIGDTEIVIVETELKN